MLVLARKKGERILIKTPTGEEVWIEVLSPLSIKVRLGVTAPLNVLIIREENLDRDSA